MLHINIYLKQLYLNIGSIKQQITTTKQKLKTTSVLKYLCYWFVIYTTESYYVN